MTAASDLRDPEEDARGFQRPLRRVRLVADGRNWSVTWDRSIHHEISAWEYFFAAHAVADDDPDRALELDSGSASGPTRTRT